MADPRVTKLANVLVHYSLALKEGQQFALVGPPAAEELIVAVYAEALRAGAYVDLLDFAPGSEYANPVISEAFYRYGSNAQLDHLSPLRKLIIETYDARLAIIAPVNTRALTHVAPEKLARFERSPQDLNKTFMTRSTSGELKWCVTAFPTQAAAQEASMSFEEYQDFVYCAGHLDAPDPIATWNAEAEHQRTLIKWLSGRDRVVMKGSDIDLTFSIAGRTFDECAGRINFPDGEIFTGPVEDSLNGSVRFRFPVIYGGEVVDARLTFENGTIVEATAEKGQDNLRSVLATDEGSRHIGEWGIGTNYDITYVTGNMLFDEKIGGTIHFAFGAGYPQTGSQNESSVHFDMLCDMTDAEITVDGDLFYKNGKPVI